MRRRGRDGALMGGGEHFKFWKALSGASTGCVLPDLTLTSGLVQYPGPAPAH